MTEFSELLKTRRSIRFFEDKEVPLDTIKEIIEDSTLAPSSGNGQPWSFIIINNKDMIKRISDESKASFLSDLEADPDSYLKKYEPTLRNKSFNVFYNTPSLVIIAGKKKPRGASVDCALAAAYFMMSASSRGLGTCWVNLGGEIRDPKTLEEIGMTDDLKIIAPMILGYPKAIPPIPKRKETRILKIIS